MFKKKMREEWYNKPMIKMNNLEGNKISNRITIAIDDHTNNMLNELNYNSGTSRSELIRNAIKFYHKFKQVFDNEGNGAASKINTYLELLSHGEHIILDVDHYLTFLKFIEKSPDKKKFEEVNKSIGRAHAEEFSQDLEITTVDKVVERLEACNFFKIINDSPNRFTLLLGSDIQKNFIKTFLEEVLLGMGFKTTIKEGFSKLKITLENKSYE